MKTLMFSTQSYERPFFDQAFEQQTGQPAGLRLGYQEARLDATSAPLAQGYDSVCAFVNDDLGGDTLRALKAVGVKLVALRCAGFNQVDLAAAQQAGITVVRVPAYSPEAVAEHTLAMILCLNRKMHKAYNRVREDNFHLQGLLGFNLHGRTAGLVGLGAIGLATARILRGFGMQVLAFDPCLTDAQAEAAGVQSVNLEALWRDSDIVSLHCPLTEQTQHMINRSTLEKMKPGAMLINTSRGGLIDTPAVIDALKSGQLGYLGIDVYEQEASLFFRDLSGTVIQDDVFQRLLTFPNVMVTGHQGFFTREALESIARTTVENIEQFQRSGQCQNAVQ